MIAATLLSYARIRAIWTKSAYFLKKKNSNILAVSMLYVAAFATSAIWGLQFPAGLFTVPATVRSVRNGTKRTSTPIEHARPARDTSRTHAQW